MLYAPLAEETVSRSRPVAVWNAVTCAPGSRRPALSRTVPFRPARVTCATQPCPTATSNPANNHVRMDQTDIGILKRVGALQVPRVTLTLKCPKHLRPCHRTHTPTSRNKGSSLNWGLPK